MLPSNYTCAMHELGLIPHSYKKNLFGNDIITVAGVSLTDNHHLKSILMIQNFTLCCQGLTYTLPSIYEANLT